MFVKRSVGLMVAVLWRLETPPEDWTGTFPSSDPTHGANIRLAEYNGLLENVTFGRP